MWGKVTLFEVCDRVPLVIRVPETLSKGQTKAGSSSEGLVELVDLFPTLAELCDLTPPDDLQGRSLVPMLNDSNAAGKQFAYTVVSRGSELGKAIRTSRWRYTKWPAGEELYDLQNDPTEQKNLVSLERHSDTVKVMRTHLVQVEPLAAAAAR
jgi:arylsulfatase A-like enzyme